VHLFDTHPATANGKRKQEDLLIVVQLLSFFWRPRCQSAPPALAARLATLTVRLASRMCEVSSRAIHFFRSMSASVVLFAPVAERRVCSADSFLTRAGEVIQDVILQHLLVHRLL